MNKIAGLPKALPSKDIPFSIKIRGNFTDHEYCGDFMVQVPSVKDISQIGIELAKINNGIPLESLDVSTANLNNCIAFLRIVLKEAPEWFTDYQEGMAYGMNTLDVNVAPAIFKEASNHIEKWQNKVRGKPEDDEKAGE